MRPRILITLGLMAAIGGTAAWFGYPPWQRHRHAAAVASADPGERAVAWAALTNPRTAPLPYDRVARQVHRALLGASDAALVDAAFALEKARRLTWESLSSELCAPLLAALAEGGHSDPAIRLIERAPLDTALTAITPSVSALLGETAPDRRAAAFDALAGWAGVERFATLFAGAMPDAADERRRRLCLAACGRTPGSLPIDAMLEEPVDLLEARLLCLVRATPGDVETVLAAETSLADDARPAFVEILRYATDPRAAERIDDLAAGGDRAATFASQLRDQRRSDDVARRVLGDPSYPLATRRLAAWRLDDIDGEATRALLAEGVADDDGSICSAVLLAERHLERVEASELAESWIRSFDDDEKRAGAILAALLGSHHELLAMAMDREDVAAVRTAQRLALEAMTANGAPSSDLVEMGGRMTRGGAAYDATLCLLIAGHVPALRRLTTRPTRDWTKTVQRRAWMIERFAPTWHAWSGRPLGGSTRALELHFDALDARAALEQRRIRFDASRHLFASENPDTAGRQAAQVEPIRSR